MPAYEKGDFVKVEFPDETTGISEWMWVRVHSSDDGKRLVFGILDSVPLNTHAGRLALGSEVAISFDRIRDHKKSSAFDQSN